MPLSSDMTTAVDIVIPVYNEGTNILAALNALRQKLEYRARVLICYDHDEDDTLVALAAYNPAPLELCLVRNQARGGLGAVKTGCANATAPCVITLPADDDCNAP